MFSICAINMIQQCSFINLINSKFFFFAGKDYVKSTVLSLCYPRIVSIKYILMYG